MKTAKNIFACLLLLIGAVWALQGLNIIGGSFMTGQSQWLVIGVIVMAIGAALLIWANWRKSPLG